MNEKILIVDDESDIREMLSSFLKQEGYLFIPYFTSKPKGTGLGLPVVKRIVEKHGGSINVKPKSEKEPSLPSNSPRSESKKKG